MSGVRLYEMLAALSTANLPPADLSSIAPAIEHLNAGAEVVCMPEDLVERVVRLHSEHFQG
jgi:hypothetical protein